MTKSLKAAAREAEEAAKLGKKGGRIARKIIRIIPGVGIAVTIVFGAKSLQAKGLGGGAADIALDQTPIVGEIKAVIEIVTGEDIVPDYHEQTLREVNPPVPSKDWKPPSEKSGSDRTQYLPGEIQQGLDLSNWFQWFFGGTVSPDDEDVFGPGH